MPIINTSLASAIQDKRPDCQPSSSTACSDSRLHVYAVSPQSDSQPPTSELMPTVDVNANGTDPGSTFVLTTIKFRR